MPQVTTNYPGTINFPTETEGAFEDIIYGAPCNLEIRYVGHEGLLYRRSRWQHHQLRRPPGRRLTTGWHVVRVRNQVAKSVRCGEHLQYLRQVKAHNIDLPRRQHLC